jgi:hypothetical protein
LIVLEQTLLFLVFRHSNQQSKQINFCLFDRTQKDYSGECDWQESANYMT